MTLTQTDQSARRVHVGGHLGRTATRNQHEKPRSHSHRRLHLDKAMRTDWLTVHAITARSEKTDIRTWPRGWHAHQHQHQMLRLTAWSMGIQQTRRGVGKRERPAQVSGCYNVPGIKQYASDVLPRHGRTTAALEQDAIHLILSQRAACQTRVRNGARCTIGETSKPLDARFARLADILLARTTL
jgi:hypothetical protein